MQFTQEHSSHGAVTVTLAGQKTNSALAQTVRVEALDNTHELTIKEQNAREQLEKQVEQSFVSTVQEDSCHLELWNGTVEFIELDYLQSLNYSPEECTQMQKLATRLIRLLDCSTLEKAGCVLLEHLGKIKRPYLTPLEEQLLRLLERESGVYLQEEKTCLSI